MEQFLNLEPWGRFGGRMQATSPSPSSREAPMAHSSRILTCTALAVALSACTLPGAASPTPFTFPTPNLTLTAIFAPTASPNSATQAPPAPIATSLIATSTPSAADQTTTPDTTPITGDDVRPNGLPVTADFFSAPPVIDGDLSDWDANQYGANQITYGAGAWTGGSDASATYSLGWDSANLYIAARVTDDTFVQVASGRTLYKGDSAELLLDADLLGDFSSSTLSSDDFQLGFSPGNFTTVQPSAYRWFPASQEGSLTSVETGSAKTDAGYDLEIRVPWAVFGVSPVSNRHYGFVFSISDDDSSGTAVQQSLVSSVGTRSSHQSNQLGDPGARPADRQVAATPESNNGPARRGRFRSQFSISFSPGAWARWARGWSAAPLNAGGCCAA